MITQGNRLCEKIKAHEVFGSSPFNLVGFSQGELLARYIIEDCDLPEGVFVNRYMSVGGPNQGVQRSPHCMSTAFWCLFLDFIEEHLSMLGLAQKHIAPASYWRSNESGEKYETYLRDSEFLPYLNNEKQHDKYEQYRDRFRSLSGVMFVRFQNDTMVFPGPGELFQDRDSTTGEILTLNATKIWLDDSLGLQELNETGKVNFATVRSADHLHITTTNMQLFMVPWLYSLDWQENLPLVNDILRLQDVFTETEIEPRAPGSEALMDYRLRGSQLPDGY